MEKYHYTGHTCYLQLYIIVFTKFQLLHTNRVDQCKHIHYFWGEKNNIPSLEEPRFWGFILSFHK